jgi:hypothetical protein
VRQVSPNVYVSLGNFYHARREARRAALALGAATPEYETTVIDCQCARCHRPIACAIRFRFTRGDVTSHELLPGSSECETCGLAMHSRNLLYVPETQ